jgi:hypothetical protein
VAVAVIALSGAGGSAKADSVTFLQFFQTSAKALDFSWKYGAGGSIDNVPAKGIPVVINVDPVVGGFGPVLGSLLDMHLTMAKGATFGASGYTQQLGTGYIDVLLAKKSVLHVAITAARLTGKGKALTVSASEPSSGITYSSTMFPLINGYNRDQNFSLSFSALSVVPTGVLNGYLISSKGKVGMMSGSGTFAGAPVPEPGTFALAGVGSLSLLGFVARRKRASRG